MTTITESLGTHLMVYLTYVCHKCTSPPKVFKTPFNLRRHLTSPAHIEALLSQYVRRIYTFVTGETNVVVVGDTANEAPSQRKKTFNFHPATVKPASKLVKITGEIVSALQPILTIVKDDLISDQTNVLSLKLYPTAHNLIVIALKAQLADLPRFLWTFEHKNDLDKDDTIFVNIIQCVLADFYRKSQRSPHYQSKYERTFWIDRVVHIFRALGNHSQLLGFQWCKIPTEEHMEFILDPHTLKRNVSNNFHDDVGYDDRNRNRLSFCVQCSCINITLSITTLDPENDGSYITIRAICRYSNQRTNNNT
ncbi:C2H2-type zinc finger transcription factor [Phycomyces blakesleeanus NRRL 1555(-)]|uniref:C2H2-type zinc finger transcription factor n=1 Tax=Phycomyces blakesleeanus (strain ATCC 8743b / DSM 1359 / FGSC 10004 / NBRC 33097 / NRRL 1555) TaxID=763407 RepID=A0A162ZN24_PHYB8|nr:C2H2-type zinc finger transcription factor [Phycomyces blakesleeanus NRRL 1555(-)]OAD67971.1 C2H2-type zinc finger transcription factor [Phycomyces blakesleeanus NRRL 1555(-)]|eukprot:XP_018286011.1 C2H2-type zinc finger transcription factor [Phycomyces blakesleeanus NRRL 1555(-)]